MLVACVAALLLVAAVALAAAVARHDTTRSSATAVGSQQHPGPVLLVPGYGGSRDSLSVLADRIRVAGREAEVMALPGDGTGDLLAQVAVLDRGVADAMAGGAPSVDVIGYSAGGVVVRLWIARNGDAQAARRVVTLGAPLHGAQIAAVGGALVPGACPVACQQLAPGGTLLSQLDRQPPQPRPQWLSIWTEDDETVTPPESARLAGAVNVPLQQVCTDARVEHSQLPTDPLVTGIVLRALGTGPLTHPRPDECSVLRAEGSRG
jgi:triacylglycerol esterase/lipase EstA (alpha/beta hydrolase family)